MATIMCGLLARLLLCLLYCNVCLCEDYCRERFEHCICTEESLECHREQTLTDIRTLLNYIRDHVTRIVVEGSNIPELGQNVLGKCDHDPDLVLLDLKQLDLSNNSIRKIHRGAFTCMPYLEELVLSQNDLVVDSEQSYPGYFTPLRNLKRLDLTNAFSDEPRNQTIQTNIASILDSVDATKLETLVLSYNELATLPTRWISAMCSMLSLKTLDLSHNNLVTTGIFPGSPDYCLGGLVSLDLSSNKLERLPKFLLEKIDSLNSLKSLRIGYNPFECNCRFLETYNWLRQSEVQFDDDAVICVAGNPSLHGRQVMSLRRDELCASTRDSHETTETGEKPESTTLSTTLAMPLVYQNCQDLARKIKSTNEMARESDSNKTLKRCEALLNLQSSARGHSGGFVFGLIVVVLMVN